MHINKLIQQMEVTYICELIYSMHVTIMIKEKVTSLRVSEAWVGFGKTRGKSRSDVIILIKTYLNKQRLRLDNKTGKSVFLYKGGVC